MFGPEKRMPVGGGKSTWRTVSADNYLGRRYFGQI
jgi:hypothetical protein